MTGRATALLVAFLASSPLAAQGPPPSTPDSVRVLEGITVSVPRPALTTGGASTVVLELDSARHVPQPTLEDVLRRMPLIQIRRNTEGRRSLRCGARTTGRSQCWSTASR